MKIRPALFVVALAACAHARAVHTETAHVAPVADLRCWTCETVPIEADIARAIDARIADLQSRGDACQAYGRVMEETFRSGKLSLRPSMWRHQGRLVAGEATPDGDISLARDIDSLNVGRRNIDEIVWTMEHEAVHIAFKIPSASHGDEAIVEARVRSCRS